MTTNKTIGDPNNKELQHTLGHYMETLGNVPDPIRAMAEYCPEAFLGYSRTRKYIMARPEDGGALDLKTKELLYVLLDVVEGNLDGAKNHVNAAIREGLTLAQLVEGCMQVMAVCGIETWGQTGWKLCDYVAEVERNKKGAGKAKTA